MEITLNSKKHGNKTALIDLEDFNIANSITGYWVVNYNPSADVFYVMASERINGKRKTVLLHRLLFNLKNKEEYVDHINHDGLDNRRKNLRVVTNSENQQNSRISKNNTSGFTGVTRKQGEEKWTAKIRVNRKHIYLGQFNSKSEAIKARKNAERKYFKYKTSISK